MKSKSKNIKEKYQEADIFCLPSFYEGTPNVICEAISVGLPVVCSNVCDNSIYVHDGKNGLLFDPQNPSDIAEKIKALINMGDNEYLGMRRECRAIAEELLSPSVFLKKYQELI